MATNDVEFDKWYEEHKRDFYLHKLSKREVARKAWEEALHRGFAGSDVKLSTSKEKHR